ncbi:hypothetical protein [Falsirhodobacter algicola]|uniref:Uncharacterized protein n=1 Tax=Falsirhodobacter algicola TaxID=2692330 RepID=A0A8J8MRZ9_9RHOB|nr:hypothetical protein [Falsirhodobacter algicola]QUS35344.1 hypothetical protein GR316_03075 [Falsirhodobacter algicola]
MAQQDTHDAAPSNPRGTLPDAPLAMPKQVLQSTQDSIWKRLFSLRLPRTDP